MNTPQREENELELSKKKPKHNKKLPKPQRIPEDRLMEKRHIHLDDITDIIDEDDNDFQA